MNKYCPNCGTSAEQNAAFCPNCGAKFAPAQQASPNQNTPSQGNYPSQQPINHQVTYNNSFMLVQQVAQKMKSASIFWLVYGILQIISAISCISAGAVLNSSVSRMFIRLYGSPGTGIIVFGSFLLVAAIVNIAYAIIHFSYSKTIVTNPTAVMQKVQSPVLYVISIVVNVLFGGVIGIIGGVMMMNARSTAATYLIASQSGTTNPNNPNVVPPQAQQQYKANVAPNVAPPTQNPAQASQEEKEPVTVASNSAEDNTTENSDTTNN